MEVKLATSGKMVTAHLRIPRRWLITAVLTLGALLANAGATWAQFQQVKAKLAACEARINSLAAAPSGE